MAIIRMQVTLAENSPGVGADVFTNVFHCVNIAPAAPQTAAANFEANLSTFYVALINMMGSLVGGPLRFKAYNLNDAEPRTPILDTEEVYNPLAAATVPPELAVCVSFRAPYESGTPDARRRGRIYLPPFALGAIAEDSGLVNPSYVEDINAAAGDLLAASQADATYSWVIYSQADHATYAVEGGWVDNEWDQQRRRSLEVTHREQFGIGH